MGYTWAWRNLARYDLGWLGVLTFFAVLPAAIRAELNPLSAWWLFLLVLALGAGFAAPAKSAAPAGLVELVIPVLLFGAALGVFGNQLSTNFIGMDEDMIAARVLRLPSLTRVAVRGFQQPPLFTYLVRSTIEMGGVSLAALRTVPVLFGALCLPLFFRVLVRAGASVWLAGIGACFLLVDEAVIRLARELRAYTSGVFFLLVYLLVLMEPAGERRNRFLRLFVASLLFLVSLGVQPVLLCLAATLGWAWLRKGEPECLFPLGAFTLAFFLFLPFQVHSAGTYSPFLSPFFTQPLAALQAAAKDIWLLAPIPGILFLFLPLAFVAGVTARRTSAVESLLLLLPFFLFPFYLSFFAALSGGMHHSRYLLFLHVAALLAMFTALALVARKGKVAAVAALLLAAGILALQALQLVFPRAGDQRYRAFFDYLEAKPPANALALMFSVAPAEVAEFSGFVGLDFYLSPVLRNSLSIESAWGELGRRSQAAAIHAALAAKLEPSEVILYDANFIGTKRLDSYELSNVIGSAELETAPRRTLVVRLGNAQGLERTFERFLLDLEAQEKDEPLRFRIYLGLSALRAYQGRCDEAGRYLERARLIPGRKERMHDPLSSELRIVESCMVGSENESGTR